MFSKVVHFKSERDTNLQKAISCCWRISKTWLFRLDQTFDRMPIKLTRLLSQHDKVVKGIYRSACGTYGSQWHQCSSNFISFLIVIKLNNVQKHHFLYTFLFHLCQRSRSLTIHWFITFICGQNSFMFHTEVNQSRSKVKVTVSIVHL